MLETIVVIGLVLSVLVTALVLTVAIIIHDRDNDGLP